MNHHREFLYKLIRPVLTVLFRVYFHPDIVNSEAIPKLGAAVIAGNHKHALDPILVDVCTKRVVHTLAKKELHDGAFGWFFRSIGTIPVETKAKHNRQSFSSAVNYLNKGALINLSPEGTRNNTSELLLPFKAGAVVMAQRTKSNIIPYAITGDYRFRSKNLKIVFGKPLDVSNRAVDEANQMLFNEVRQLIIGTKQS